MSVFVVGVDGTIGAALYGRLKRGGAEVLGSTRREASRGLISLNMAPLNLAAVPKADVAVVCAGVTSLAACRNAPAATRDINVGATLALANALARKGAFVVAFSTNLVFDGSSAQRRGEEMPSPACEYGHQKCALEQGMRDLGNQGAVVRLTKVVSPEMALLKNWRAALAKGEVITPFSGMVMAPITLRSVIDALIALTLRRAPGVYQLSAVSDISYTEAAQEIATLAMAPLDLVQPRDPPIDVIATERPAHTSLDTSRAQADLGWRPVNPLDALAEVYSK
jgi:dTDP-4-dehydrorhamnose reductase